MKCSALKPEIFPLLLVLVLVLILIPMAPLLHEKEFVGQINIVGQHLPLSLHLETRVTCWQLALRMNKWQVRQVMQVGQVRNG